MNRTVTTLSLERRPSREQLLLLRRLAERTEQTFAYPVTAAQARDEIHRLCAAVLATLENRTEGKTS